MGDKIKVPIILILFLPSMLFSSYRWEKTYVDLWCGEDIEKGYSVAQTTGSGFAIAGYTKSFGAGDEDALVIRFNDAEEETWRRTIGREGTDIGYAVAGTSDDGVVVVGYTNSFTTGEDLLIAKFDLLGNNLWTKTLGFLDGSADFRGYSVIESSDKGIVIAGHYYVVNWNRHELLITKFDSLGNHLWTTTVYLPQRQHYGYSLAETCDGGYLVAGQVWLASGEADILLVKFDSLGNRLGAWRIGEEGLNETANSIKRLSDCGFALTGWAEDTQGKKRLFIMKLNPSLYPVWGKIVPVNLPLSTEGLSVDESDYVPRDIVVAGGWFDLNLGYGDFLIGSFDESGNQNWMKFYGFYPGEERDITFGTATSMFVDHYKILATGYTFAYGYELEVAKFRTDGITCMQDTLVPPCEDWTPTEDTLFTMMFHPSVIVLDQSPVVTDPSLTFTEICVGPMNCGDINCDGLVGCPNDALYLANYIFAGGPPPCAMWAADVNCSGDVDINDLLYYVTWCYTGSVPLDCCPEDP